MSEDNNNDSRQEPGSRLGEGTYTRRHFLGAIAATGLAASVSGSVLAACGGGSGGAASPAAEVTTSAPKMGGSLRIGLATGSSKDTLSPFNSQSYADLARSPQIWETALEYDPQMKLQKSLLEEIEATDQSRTWTLRVRDGVQFNNGKPLTAKDLAYTFEQFLMKKNAAPSRALIVTMDTNSFEYLDERTLRLKFATPNSPFADMLADCGSAAIRIIPEGWKPGSYVGTGAFVFDSFEPGLRSVFKKNPNYWRSGQPYVDEVVMTNLTDDTARINALLSGQVDGISLVPNSQVPVIQAKPDLKVVESASGAWNPITMRCGTPPFEDVRVRQAFRLLADRPQLVSQVMAGKGAAANDLFGRYDSGYNSSLPQRERDPEKAVSLLKAAGRYDTAYQFVTAAIASGVVEAAEAYVKQVKDAGVNITLKQVDVSTFWSQNFLKAPLCQDFWITRNYLPQCLQSMVPDAFWNDTQWQNDQWFKLVQEALAAVDEAKRNELVSAAQEIEWNEGGYLNWGWNDNFCANNQKLKGVVPDASGQDFVSWRLWKLWLA
jgi:peptide/nickel transport system substrate-binding protein